MGNSSTQTNRKGSQRLVSGLALLVMGLLIALAGIAVVAGPQLLARSLPASVSVPADTVDEASVQALAKREAEARGQLESYGWVDRDAGIAHIPLAAAMQRVAEAGLPVGAPTPAPGVVSEEGGGAEGIPATVSFQTHVLPIFVERCSECHGDDNPEEGLEVTSYRTLMLGSIYGSVIKPGDVEGSYLFEQIEGGKMPKKGDALTPTQIEIVRRWIEAGALDN